MGSYISETDFKQLLEDLSKTWKVVVPVKTSYGHYYEEYKGSYDFSFIQTLNTPKDWLVPQKEVLFTYQKRKPVAKYTTTKTIIFGVKQCDQHGILTLDKRFKEDPYYQKRRKNIIIAGLDCNHGDEHCFCTSVGTHTPANNDFNMQPYKNGYLVHTTRENPITKNKYFKKTSEELVPSIPINKKWDIKNLTTKMNENYEHELWDKLAKTCVECGKCTAVCPTCYCFENKEDEASRCRMWSSCQFKEFTQIAGNRIFRKDLKSRVRHRFYHKFHYAKADSGIIECIACGRCSRTCPVDIRMLETMQEVTK